MSGSPSHEKQPRIESILVAVADEPDGTEGLCAVLIGNEWMPLVAGLRRREDFVRAEALKIAHQSGKIVRLIRLTGREEVEVIDGRREW